MHLKPRNGRTKLGSISTCELVVATWRKKNDRNTGSPLTKRPPTLIIICCAYIQVVIPRVGWLEREAIWSKMPVTCLFSAQWAHAPARHKDLYYRPSITASNKNTLKFVIKNIRCWASSENISSCQRRSLSKSQSRPVANLVLYLKWNHKR